MISTSLEDRSALHTMMIEEPQAYVDVPPDHLIHAPSDCLHDSDDDDDDELFGFEKNDPSFLVNTNRMIDLRISNRYRRPCDFNWNPDKPIMFIKRKRNHPDAVNSVHDMVASVRSTNTPFESVPKRIRRRKVNIVQ